MLIASWFDEPVASFPENLAERGEEIVKVEGLLNVASHGVPKLGLHLCFGHPREEQDAGPRVDPMDGFEHLLPRHARHDEIEKHGLDLLGMLAEEGHPRGPIAGGQDREALPFQDVSEDLADQRVIVDDQEEPAASPGCPRSGSLGVVPHCNTNLPPALDSLLRRTDKW